MSGHVGVSLRPLTQRILVYADDDNDLYFVVGVYSLVGATRATRFC